MPVNETKPKSVPLIVRLPQPLHQTIRTLASEGYRSLNSQVIMLLKQALAAQEASTHQRPS